VTTSEWNTGPSPDPEATVVREIPGTGGAAIPPSSTERTFSIDEQAGRSRAGGSKEEKPKPSTTHTIVSWGITIAIAIVATLAVRAFVFEQYSIPSPSMVPTLDVGDRVLVSKLNRTPGRGDVVVFNRPSNDPPQTADDPKVLIKRVIGLPGETVEARDGKVYVDGKALNESYLPKGTVTTIAKPITVPKGDILVLGDNRGVSQDGRYFGPIPESLIVGRAILRIWPLSRFGTL
jgi:signal peptidase I